MNLNFSLANLNQLARVEHWIALNAEMGITDYPFLTPADPDVQAHPVEVRRCVQQMKEEGYFRLENVLSKGRMARMAKAVEAIVAAGYPPAFAYVYDDFWLVFRDLGPVLTPLYGENYRVALNLWAWHIPPSDSYHGFQPHRDLIGRNTLRADGSPMLGTVWIPLTDVTTQHACMYVLPTNEDPNVPEKVTSCVVSKENLQAIRALPAEAGSVLGWNSYALHWGSKSSRWAQGPRISIATYIKRAEEKSFNSVSVDPSLYLSLERRLAVIGQNMAHYDTDDITETRYPKKLLDFCERYTKKHIQAGTAKTATAPAGSSAIKVGRNDPCPCGSSRKFKQCHGRV